MFGLDNKFLILVVASLLIYAVIVVISMVVRNKKLDQMVALLNEKRFDEFDKLVDSKIVKWVFDPFNIDYVKLNSYMIRGNKKLIDKQFEVFENKRIKKHQRDDVDLKAFNYYLQEGESKKTKKYYDRIQASSSNEMKKYVDRLYSVYELKESKYLNELLDEIETLEDKYKSADELLVSAIYGNMGNKKKEKEYRELAESHLK